MSMNQKSTGWEVFFLHFNALSNREWMRHVHPVMTILWKSLTYNFKTSSKFEEFFSTVRKNRLRQLKCSLSITVIRTSFINLCEFTTTKIWHYFIVSSFSTKPKRKRRSESSFEIARNDVWINFIEFLCIMRTWNYNTTIHSDEALQPLVWTPWAHFQCTQQMAYKLVTA